VGESVTTDGAPLTVIGVLASSGSSSEGSSSEDDAAVVPIGTAKGLTGSTTDSVSSIYVEGKSQDTLGAAYDEITNLLLNLHDVSSPEADFTVTSQQSLLQTANSTNKTLTVLLGGVAAISLLVGGIGVMNIMLVSVTERIREIGLRKALGATPRVIRRQFLVEASLLGLAGGLVGVVIGFVGAQILPGLINQPVSVSALATAAAIGTSLALGIGFGVYPASRAARLTPIDALRSE
jgi:putative ABC transport system permease protein